MILNLTFTIRLDLRRE